MKRVLYPSLPLAALLMLGGCVDDNYDLANIDTTTQIQVNGLVVPVNLSTITLDNVLDIDDSESLEIQTLPSGEKIYVFKTNGNFNSDEFSIDPFRVTAPSNVNPSVVTLDLLDNLTYRAKKNYPTLPGHFTYQITPMRPSTFSYNIDDVDPKVKSVTEITTPSVTFTIDLNVPAQVATDAQSITLDNVTMEFPKGLQMLNGNPAQVKLTDYKDGIDQPATYDPETGLLTITKYVSYNGSVNLVLNAEVLDCALMGVQLNNGHFTYDGQLQVKSGHVLIEPKPGKYFDPSFTFTAQYVLSSFDVSTFSGSLDYDIENLDFDPVSLGDMPDFLSQDGTNVKLADPQIYLSIFNPCAPYDLGGILGLEIVPFRDNGYRLTAGTPLVMNQYITVGHNLGTGPYMFAISPLGNALDLQQNMPSYNLPQTQKALFSDLGNVLYDPNGGGIPKELQINILNPKLDGTANRFPVMLPGNSKYGVIEPVHGEYEFRAPLALAQGSQIVYSDADDDWDSSDLDDLYLSEAQVTANAVSQLPIDVTLEAYLVDKDGHTLGRCEGTTLEANSTSPIDIKILPSVGQDYIRNMDGIRYTVKAIANQSQAEALSPDMNIKLTDIKLKVSGKYLTVDSDYEQYYPENN